MKKIYIDSKIQNPEQAAERLLACGQCVKGNMITKTDRGDYIVDHTKAGDQEKYNVFQFDEKTYLLV